MVYSWIMFKGTISESLKCGLEARGLGTVSL